MRGLYGKVFAWGFSYRPSDEGTSSVRKNRKQILSPTDRVNEVNKEFIIWLLVYFLLKFATLFLSSEFAVTLSCQLFCVNSSRLRKQIHHFKPPPHQKKVKWWFIRPPTLPSDRHHSINRRTQLDPNSLLPEDRKRRETLSSNHSPSRSRGAISIYIYIYILYGWTHFQVYTPNNARWLVAAERSIFYDIGLPVNICFFFLEPLNFWQENF